MSPSRLARLVHGRVDQADDGGRPSIAGRCLKVLALEGQPLSQELTPPHRWGHNHAHHRGAARLFKEHVLGRHKRCPRLRTTAPPARHADSQRVGVKCPRAQPRRPKRAAWPAPAHAPDRGPSWMVPGEHFAVKPSMERVSPSRMTRPPTLNCCASTLTLISSHPTTQGRLLERGPPPHATWRRRAGSARLGAQHSTHDIGEVSGRTRMTPASLGGLFGAAESKMRCSGAPGEALRPWVSRSPRSCAAFLAPVSKTGAPGRPPARA